MLTENQLKVFDKVIHIPAKKEVKIKNKDRVKSTFDIIKKRLGLRDFIFNITALRIRKIKYTIDSVAENSIHGRLLGELFNDYDVYHFHYAAPGFLYPIKFVPRDKIKMISIWGSDLFQTAGVKNYSEQLSAFEAADFIIINTIEKKVERKFGLIVTSGYKSGSILILLPDECLCVNGGVSKKWILENWNKWIYDCNINEVLFSENYIII